MPRYSCSGICKAVAIFSNPSMISARTLTVLARTSGYLLGYSQVTVALNELPNVYRSSAVHRFIENCAARKIRQRQLQPSVPVVTRKRKLDAELELLRTQRV